MISAREALERLREGNRRFVSDVPRRDTLTSQTHRSELAAGQEPFAIILGCSDSRVPAEIVFDQGLGDLFVIRVAGNIVASSQVGSVEFAAARFGTPLVVVLGHCLFSTDDGTLITKAQYYEHMRKMPVEYDRSTNPREFVVHVYGNTAVINFRVTAHEQFGDTDIISEQRRTETWFKQDWSWLLIAIQWDNLPVNFHKPGIANTRIYKDYVGKYEWRPGTTDNIIVKDGKLWSEMGGDADECFPAGGETFFFKDDLGSISFSRDAASHVTGYTYRRVDGQEIHAKKIK